MTTLQLSAAEYNVLWRRLHLGDKPLVLDTLDHGSTFGERDALDERAWQQLRARSLVGDRDAAPEVTDVLGTLARPEREVDLRVWTGPGAPVTAFACFAGTIAAVATLLGGGLLVRSARSSQLAQALLAHLPDHPAASGNPVSVPETLVTAGLRGDVPLDRLERGGLTSTDARQVRRLLTGRTVRQMKIGAAARDRSGVRRRARSVVSLLDTAAGRILVKTERGRLLLAPADRGRILTEVSALLARHPTR